jgi:hypothetical protein
LQRGFKESPQQRLWGIKNLINALYDHTFVRPDQRGSSFLSLTGRQETASFPVSLICFYPSVVRNLQPGPMKFL